MYKTICIKSQTLDKDFLTIIESIATRRLAERSGVVCTSKNAEAEFSFEYDLNLQTDAYRITKNNYSFTFEASSRCGFLSALGHALRDGSLSSDGFEPGLFHGEVIPEKPFRSMYFATHFHNFYHDAPMEKILRYIEDLTLWGLNTICFWFDLHHYSACDDPEAITMITRIKQMMIHAEKLGLKTMLLILSNEMFAGSPEDLRADWTAQGQYHSELMGHYHIEVCPSKPGGMEAILKTRREMLEAFSDTPLDYITIWPYDQGGCTCAACAPWGANGFLRVARALKQVINSIMPKTKICLSAWYFDHFTKGEWDAFIKVVKEGDYAEWVEYLVMFFHEDANIPETIVSDRNLAGIPLIGFPEISMYGAEPWGGFGANPMTDRLARLWERDGALMAGGYPYSEGIYEDINKAVMLSLYAGRHKTAEKAVEEYVSFEFSQQYSQEITNIILMMEHTLMRARDEKAENIDKKHGKFVLWHTEQVDEIYERILTLHDLLDDKTKLCWRWKILYLRALIDYELFHNNFLVSDKCEAYLEELTEIYHAEYANYYVAPPTMRSLMKKKEFYLV